MQAVRELGAILGIWAHPDDETYLSGGVMAAAAAGGQRVACVTATAGERGTSDPVRWPPQRLARIRRRELAEALALLGVEEHTWLGYPDGGCRRVRPDEAVARLGRIIDEFRPDTILTFGPDGVTGHPDHITVGRWAHDAAAVADTDSRVLAAAKDPDWIRRFEDLHEGFDVFRPGYPVPVPVGRLALSVALSDEVLDSKAAALRAQASQTAPLIGAFGVERWREWIRTEAFCPRHRARGGHKRATSAPQPDGKG